MYVLCMVRVFLLFIKLDDGSTCLTIILA